MDRWVRLLGIPSDPSKDGGCGGVARKGAGWGPEASPFLASQGLTTHPTTLQIR